MLRAGPVVRFVAIALAAATWVAPAHAATKVDVTGEIDRITLNDPADPWSGGTLVVGGQVIILPRNLLLDLPANRLTLRQLYDQAPLACLASGETGLARGDLCNVTGQPGIAVVAANRTSAGNVIAGDVLIKKGVATVAGTITYIDHTDGWFRLNGNPGDPTTGAMVRLNDPTARHTMQAGLGCAGGPNCSADPRFGLDADNYTNVFSTGYPLCLPSTQPRVFVDLLGLGVTTTQASADGNNDALCPRGNRPSNSTQPVSDSRRFAPLLLGDQLTAEGNWEVVGGIRFLSSHTTKVSRALLTQATPGQPDYLLVTEAFITAPGFQNDRATMLILGTSTLSPSDVLFWSVHRDPSQNGPHLLPLASTVGCDSAAGAGTCTNQGLVGAGANIFRIRYDIDFLLGLAGQAAKPKLSACAHLRADLRFGAPKPCPSARSDGTSSVAEELGVMSPMPREIQAKSGRALANPFLIAVDVKGARATHGQYLFPFGIGLGGIDIPNFAEINVDALATPYVFAGLPWNLDRRLAPGGCQGSCEAAPQPLDPFPFEGLDPRIQSTPLLPTTTYSDPAFTGAPLGSAANRIFSFIDPATGRFQGQATLLAWPPADPPAIVIPPTPEVTLVCAAPAPVNRPPVAVADAAIVNSREQVTVQVLANDSDPDGNPLTVVSVTNGLGGTATTDGTTVTYVPGPGFVGGDAVSYTITDGQGGTASAPLVVTVNPPVNHPPVANPDSATVLVGGSVTIPVLANDTDFEGDKLTVVAVTQGANGGVVNGPSGVVYTPNAGFSGVDTFTYLVSDGNGGLTLGLVTVTVAGSAPEVLLVNNQLYTAGTDEWRIQGTSTVPGASITIHLGSTLAGTVVGTATVGTNGAWSFRQRPAAVRPDASRRISIESTGGAVRLNIAVTVR